MGQTEALREPRARRWLRQCQPTGYQPFPTTGQQAAFTELTQQAKANFAIPQTASSVRDMWTGESPPSQSDLTTLQSRLGPIGGCTSPSVAQPPSYAACTPPAASTGFASADWTTVINQMLAESFPPATARADHPRRRADGGGSSNSSWRRNQNDHGARGQPSGRSSSSPCPP